MLLFLAGLCKGEFQADHVSLVAALDRYHINIEVIEPESTPQVFNCDAVDPTDKI